MASRILVINDDQAVLELYQELLSSEGYIVYLAKVMLDPLGRVEELYLDLIILDIKLGVERDGLCLLQELKIHQSTQDIPVIICTAAVEMIQEQEAFLREKGVPVVYKPFGIDDLLSVVERFINRQEKQKPALENTKILE